MWGSLRLAPIDCECVTRLYGARSGQCHTGYEVGSVGVNVHALHLVLVDSLRVEASLSLFSSLGSKPASLSTQISAFLADPLVFVQQSGLRSVSSAHLFVSLIYGEVFLSLWSLLS